MQEAKFKKRRVGVAAAVVALMLTAVFSLTWFSNANPAAAADDVARAQDLDVKTMGESCGEAALAPGIPVAKFNDENANGVWDDGEEGLAGWTIVLVDFFGNEYTTTTNANGLGWIQVPWGTPTGPGYIYEVQQDGWNQTAPADNVHPIMLGCGPYETFDFGNTPCIQDVIYVMDLSGSVSNQSDLKGAIQNAAAPVQTPPTELGLVAFGQNLDSYGLSDAPTFIGNVGIASVSGSSTQLEAAVDDAVVLLDIDNNGGAVPIIVVVSDFVQSSGSNGLAAANAAKGDGVLVITVDIGSGNGLASDMATSPDHHYHVGGDIEALNSILAYINNQIGDTCENDCFCNCDDDGGVIVDPPWPPHVTFTVAVNNIKYSVAVGTVPAVPANTPTQAWDSFGRTDIEATQSELRALDDKGADAVLTYGDSKDGFIVVTLSEVDQLTDEQLKELESYVSWETLQRMDLREAVGTISKATGGGGR